VRLHGAQRAAQRSCRILRTLIRRTRLRPQTGGRSRVVGILESVTRCLCRIARVIMCQPGAL
jgi:hypothetical protein